MGMTMRLVAAVVALLVLTSGLTAQVDSVSVTIYDKADLDLTIVPSDFRGFRDDTVTFRLAGPVVDTVTGDTLDVDVTWWTDNPAAVSVNPQTGFAIFNNRGQYRIYADVTLIRTQTISFLWKPDDGVSDWVLTGSLNLGVGDTGLLCPYISTVSQDGLGNIVDITFTSRFLDECPGNVPLTPPGWALFSDDPTIASVTIT